MMFSPRTTLLNGPLVSRWLVAALLTLAVAAMTGSALAQSAPEPTRVVILPFDIDAAVSPYQLGLPTALQHALNQIPGFYVPPIGDAALMANKATDANLEVESTLGRVFNADAIVTGRVSTGGGGVVAAINVTVGGATRALQAQGSDPASLTAEAAELVARVIRPDVGADALARMAAAAATTPSVSALGPVGLAASGLPGARVDDLSSATELDSASAWVGVEYARALALSGQLEAAAERASAAIAQAPEDAEVLAVAGVVIDAAGRPEEALEAFQAALALNPSHAVALAGRAASNTSLGSEVGAAPSADLQAAIDSYPRFVDAYLRLAALQPDRQRALQTLRRAESYSPESRLLRGNVIQRLLDAGNVNDAVAYLEQAVSEPLARSAGLYSLARLLPAAAQDKAETLIEQGLAAYPDSIDLKVARADLLISSGRTEEAEALLGPLYTQNPGNMAIGNLLAVAQARRGDLEGAQRTFEELRGQGADVDRSLAELYLAAGRAAGALALLEPLVESQGDDAELQALYGTTLVRLGRLDDGKRALERALELNPEQALAIRSLELLEQQRDLTAGAAITFSEEAGVAFQQGLYALDVNDYVAAVDAFGRARAKEENGLAAFYQGYSRQLSGDTRGAVADYQVALEAFPDSDIVLNNIGYAQLELGRFDKALDHLRRAIEVNPQNAEAHLNLGIVYYAIQRYDASIAEFETAAQIDPSLESTTAGLIQEVRDLLGEQ